MKCYGIGKNIQTSIDKFYIIHPSIYVAIKTLKKVQKFDETTAAV